MLIRSFFGRLAWWRVAALLAGLGTAGCETPPPQRPPARPPAPVPAPTMPVPTAPDTLPPTAAQRGHLRYRGTLASRPVQLELMMTTRDMPAPYPPGSVDVGGVFRYLDSGEALSIGTPAYGLRASQPLEMDAWDARMGRAAPGLLCADQPVGPLLTGTFVLGRQRVPFRVREDYSDCRRYEILTEETQGPPETWHGETRSSTVTRDYLHLLGPDTLRPAWARMQCPPPAQRGRARAALAKRTNSGTYLRQFVSVGLNEANLLAYEQEAREEWLGSRYYEATVRQVLYDLRTGRELNIMDQLRPGGRRQLAQLLNRQAMADTAYARNRDHWRPGGGPLPLPDGGFAVTPEGLVAGYAEHESEPEMYGYSQTIAWASLRPLLRPRSPLYQLLQTPHR